MQQPATYPIYYQTMLTPSSSATSTPINYNLPYKSSTYISYVQPQSFIRTNNFQFNSQNLMQSFSNNNGINSSVSSISSFSSNELSNNINDSSISRSESTSSSSNINENNNNNNNNNNNSVYQLPQPIHPQNHSNPIQIPLNMSMKYLYQPQSQQFNHSVGYYQAQPLSPPLSVRYNSSVIYNNNNNNNEQQFSLTPSFDNKFENLELSCNSSFNTSFNNNNNNNSISEDIPQTNDISVLTPIPGCMAYHHPLIPIIPSASGNTRKQANKLLENTINNVNNVNNNNNNNTKGSINGLLIGYNNNDKNKENSEKTEVRRMAFGSPTWTSKDDELLRHLKETEKIGWRDISMYFPTRTINACQFRWRRLIMKEENRKKREAHKLAIKEKMLKNTKKN